MIFSTCHCWSRTPPGRGGWTKKSDKWSSTQVTMKAESTKWRQFGTARSMRESQNQVIYQVSTIWSHGKHIQRKRIPGSQLQWSSTSGSSSACSTTTTLTSQSQLLLLLTSHHRWLDQQSSQLDLPNESEDNQPTALTNELKRTEHRLIFIVFLDEFGYLTQLTSSAALHMTAHYFQPTFIKSSILGLVSLSHKTLVFLLKLPLGQEVFHRQPSINISPSIEPYPVFLFSLPP